MYLNLNINLNNKFNLNRVEQVSNHGFESIKWFQTPLIQKLNHDAFFKI